MPGTAVSAGQLQSWALARIEHLHHRGQVPCHDRRTNAFGLMMSLNMLIELGAEGGFDYTGNQFDGWCRKAGFKSTEVMPQ